MLKANGLYGHVQNNNLKSALLLFGFLASALVMTFAALLTYAVTAVFGTTETRMAWAVSALASYWPLVILCALIWSWSAYRFFGEMVRSQTGAMPIQRSQNPALFNLVENIAITMGLPVPRIEIISTPALNAYASGLSPSNSVLGLTSGLISSLTKDELESVIAHEMTHIKLLDVRLMTLATIFTAQTMAVASVIFKPVLQNGFWRLFLIMTLPVFPMQLGVVIVAAGLTAGLSALVVRFAISRTREFVADAHAYEITKNPNALISALRKIDGREMIPDADLMVQAMMIAAPSFKIFQTHPSIEQRVNAIQFYAPHARVGTPFGGQRFNAKAFNGPQREAAAMTMAEFVQMIFPTWVVNKKVIAPARIVAVLSVVACTPAFRGAVMEALQALNFMTPNSQTGAGEMQQLSAALPAITNDVAHIQTNITSNVGSGGNVLPNKLPVGGLPKQPDVFGDVIGQMPLFFYFGASLAVYTVWRAFRSIYRGAKRTASFGANLANSVSDRLSGNMTQAEIPARQRTRQTAETGLPVQMAANFAPQARQRTSAPLPSSRPAFGRRAAL